MWPPRNLRLLAAILVVAAAILGAFSTARTNQQNPGVPPPVIFASPIAGLKASELHDSFNEIHHGHRHEAIDIMKPYGTPVHAVVDGTIRKLFLSRAGGTTIYQFDTDRNYCYFYAHLDRYADGLQEGMSVERGQILGYVGTSGDAAPDAPQLHLAIMQLGPDKRWWQGVPIDPYPVLLGFLGKSSGESAHAPMTKIAGNFTAEGIVARLQLLDKQ
jgi:murein DD-endopeptidase MepM/ murein hydrolase activator NlpD